jgi:hypothetical protein
MQTDGSRCKRMGADIMHQFESTIISLNQCLLKQAKEVNND